MEREFSPSQKTFSGEAKKQGPVHVDTLDEAIRLVSEGTTSATLFPINEWDSVSFQESSNNGIFLIKVAGFPDAVGATKNPQDFTNEFKEVG